MTAASFAHLPVQVGGVALAQAGRAALWVIQRYMRSPLTNSAIAALVVTTAMAGSNALYGQHHMHPSPLFAPFTAADSAVEPVVPAIRPKNLGSKPAVVAPEQPSRSAVIDTTPGPIGNADVFEAQRKLEMLKLFTGTIDGYYGPQTARAIRKFEELQGLKPTGELTADIIEAIKNAPLSAADPMPATLAPAVVAAPAPAVVEEKAAIAVTLPQVEAPKVETDLPAAKPVALSDDAVKPQSLAMLAQPAPLTADLQTGSIGSPKKIEAKAIEAKPLSRALPDTPEEALEMAADTAGEAIETIISGVQTVAMNKSGPATPYAAADGNSLTTVAEASPDNPQVGVPLKIDEEPAKPGTLIAELDTAATPQEIAPISATDPVFVAKVQRGLASLGFLHGPADGVAGEATAKAIRNFEVYFNYDVTGRMSPELLDLLTENGAVI